MNDLVGAAARYTVTTATTRKMVDQSWQETGWDFYSTTPEVRFGATWVANAMSSATLYAGRRLPDNTIERAPDDHPAAQIVAQIAGGPEGQAQLLKAFGAHLVVAGEGWIVVRPDRDPTTPDDGITETGEEWRVLSVLEMSNKGGSLEAEVDGALIKIPPYDPRDPDPNTPLAIRVWEPHPRRHLEADSPVRASLELLEELRLLNAAVKAITRSRLTGRGVLLIPQGARFPTKPGAEDSAEDDLIDIFMQVGETAYRDPESAAATVPIILEVPAETIGDIKRLTFESDFDDLAIKLRAECITRFATGMDVPAEILLGLGDVNHWCTLQHVRIMTRTGWKTHDQVSPGDEVLTLNHDTGLSEWQPLLKVNTWDVTDETMVRINGRRHSSVTTLNHRWPILSGRRDTRGRAWTTTQELMEACREAGQDRQREEYMVLAAPHAALPTEPKYSDALVELVAWYFTEGELGIREGRNTPRVSIYQSHLINPDNCARIRRALTDLYGPESTTMDKGGRYATPESVQRRAEAKRLRAENPKMSANEIGRRLGVSGQMTAKYLKGEAKVRDDTPRWREVIRTGGEMTYWRLNSAAAEVLLEHAPGRVVTLDFIHQLTASQLELFIDTAIRGDGTMSGENERFEQKDPAMCDAFELACILAGRSVNRYEHTSYGTSADGPRLKTQNMVSASRRRLTFAPRGRSFEEFTHTGTIWCPTTQNRTWLAEDNGHVFFTGNSAWALQAEAVTLGVEPRVNTVAHALTTQYLRPALYALGLADARQWVVAGDVSSLRARSNQPQNALEVHKVGAISDEALRRETGFQEADAPTAPPPARDQDDESPGETPDTTTKEGPPQQPGGPDTAPPQAQASGTARPLPEGLLAAADGLIFNALTRSGEKLRRTPVCPRSRRTEANEIAAAALHTLLPVSQSQIDQWALLDGAFDRTPEIAARYGADPQCLRQSLETYCRELLAAGEEHAWSYVPSVIGRCDVAEVA